MPCCLDFIFMGNCREGEVDSSFRISTLAALAKMSWRRRALEAETSWEAPRWGKGWNKVRKCSVSLCWVTVWAVLSCSERRACNEGRRCAWHLPASA